MAVTAASLKANHPEFDPADNALVTAMIADASEQFDTSVVPATKLDGLVEWQTCDLLARSPFARDMRLVRDDNTTVYGDEVTRRILVIGRAYRELP